ncbi:MAG: PilZ domain-containing protein [Spirochaetaceae bacterium]|nr:PilZ domain-containing protein [Myxococcales bacterium]MCB9722632.1 PilZ domain-containing protein [Spirochaetaceae bacterium]
MRSDCVQVRFDSPESLRAEFEKNISNRGVFVATERSFEARQAIEVDVILEYVSENAPAVTLAGEVVHVVAPGMEGSGMLPGVAVQLDASAPELRALFEPLLGQGPLPPRDADRQGAKRRASKRESVRVPVRVMPETRPPFEATSRDLSGTGILLSTREHPLALDERVRVCLWHPTGQKSVEVDARVVREVKNAQGRVAAVALDFDRTQCAEPRVREVVDALREAGHRAQLGGIRGSLGELGLPNMLQMFGSSCREGTLVVEHAGEQGWIAFAEGRLLGAEIGALRGVEALATLIGWGDGRFEFQATVDGALAASEAPGPSLEGAVLEAVCQLDERERDAALDGETADADDGEAWQEPFAGLDESEADDDFVVLDADSTFAIDATERAAQAGSLGKVEEAVLELAGAGMSLARLFEIIPEPPERIQSAVESLVELGVLCPR